MLAERIALAALTLSSTAAGWSAVGFQESRLARHFQRFGVTSYRASLANGEIRYWAGGRADGKPLLLVHGFGGDGLLGWGSQARLARDRLLIVPDLLWFGDSHAHREDFSPRFQAETLVQLLDHLAIEQADVAGISYGGFVAGELAHGWSERVRRLIIVDSPGHTYTLLDYHEMLDRLGLESIAEMVTPDEPAGVQRLMRLAYRRPPPVPAFVARDVFARMFVRWKVEKVRLLDHLLALADGVKPGDYRITQPTLVLWGEHDQLFPVPLAYRLAGAIEAPARVHVIPGTNHAPNMERPLYFDARVREHLAG